MEEHGIERAWGAITRSMEFSKAGEMQKAAVPYAVLGDPQSLNLYTYVRNLPTTRYDLNGHFEQRDNSDKLDKKLPPPDAQHDHSITVRYVEGRNGNVFGHVTVQIDNGKEVGFDPKQDQSKTEIFKETHGLNNNGVPGKVEERAAGVKTKEQATVHVTADQARAAQKTIDGRSTNPGNYHLELRNCSQFAADVLHSAGAKAPDGSTGVLPVDFVGNIRAQQYEDHSTQSNSTQPR
jgi:hypothetical protein